MNKDDNQFKEYLKLKYPEKNIETLFKYIYIKVGKKNKRKRKAEYIYSTLKKPKFKSFFDLIVFTDNNKLSSTPIYSRYAAYLVTEYGYKKAEELLYISRTSIWRLIKDQ